MDLFAGLQVSGSNSGSFSNSSTPTAASTTAPSSFVEHPPSTTAAKGGEQAAAMSSEQDAVGVETDASLQVNRTPKLSNRTVTTAANTATPSEASAAAMVAPPPLSAMTERREQDEVITTTTTTIVEEEGEEEAAVIATTTTKTTTIAASSDDDKLLGQLPEDKLSSAMRAAKSAQAAGSSNAAIKQNEQVYYQEDDDDDDEDIVEVEEPPSPQTEAAGSTTSKPSSWFGGWFSSGSGGAPAEPAPAAATDHAQETQEPQPAEEAAVTSPPPVDDGNNDPAPSTQPTEQQPQQQEEENDDDDEDEFTDFASGGATPVADVASSDADQPGRQQEEVVVVERVHETAQMQLPPPQQKEEEENASTLQSAGKDDGGESPAPDGATSPEPVAVVAAETGEEPELNEELEPPLQTPTKKEMMNEEDRQALEDAFTTTPATPRPHASRQKAVTTTPTSTPQRSSSTNAPKSSPSRGGESVATLSQVRDEARQRGLGVIHPETPIPNSDIALRILRKFAHKTRPKIVRTYGGSKTRSLVSFFFGTSKEDPIFVPYRNLMDVLFEEGEDRDLKEDSDHIVDMVMGENGDSMAKARLSVAAFVNVFSVWCHASSGFSDARSQQAFSDLLVVSLDIASLLVAHGCLDGVLIAIGPERPNVPNEYHKAITMLAQSVFSADLSMERNELAALKFLLGSGCRVGQDGDALLRGSHLLQTIRTLYHVYLTTDSTANKTTARAALQQLIMSVFSRLIHTDMESDVPVHSPGGGIGIGGVPSADSDDTHFPTPNHRDAYLVLRSICKLSMRSLPQESGMHSHIGFQTSGSNEAWDGDRNTPTARATVERPSEPLTSDSAHRENAQLIYTSAIHPALESKLLALELLLYVLKNTKFTNQVIQHSGAQFHAAVRNYLCVSLLKNCTSDDTQIVSLSLRIFVPLMQNFRSILKTEIEAFVTNVFFVILDSKNSPAEHKSIVVKTFDAICSDPTALAEIFLNYDCDLSAVDLFHRIVNTLARVARTELQEPRSSGLSILGGASAARMERQRNETRVLRLDAMKALRQVLASLHASIVEPVNDAPRSAGRAAASSADRGRKNPTTGEAANAVADKEKATPSSSEQQSFVEIYDSKKRRRAEESEAILRFNQKPSAGIKYAAQCKHIDGDDPVDVARYLLKMKDLFDKTQIGEYLGREADYQNGFAFKVLHEYIRLLDFGGLNFDEAIRFFLSGFRLPGEAQKIDRIMEKFAERFTEQNPDVFPTADVAFILAFSIIMLNTDLHNPAIKEERRMTKEGFIRNNRGIADGKDLPEEFLSTIFDRIKKNPISLKEDDEARERVGDGKASSSKMQTSLNPSSFFTSHYSEMDRARETNFQKERDHIVRTTESLLKRRRHSTDASRKDPNRPRPGKTSRPAPRFVLTEDSGLRDEYVSPMFEVTWGPALAAFSTAIESGNGTIGTLIAIASDEELELAVENAAETIEVCLTGFRFAVCTAGLCGNDTARGAYMLALSRFSQLGTGVLLEPRHVRCMQTMLGLAREDGELLGTSWEHVFRALSEINRFHQLFQLMARNDRAAAEAAERRRRRVAEIEKRRKRREERRAAADDNESIVEDSAELYSETDDDSLAESDLFHDDDDFLLDDDMDAKEIDEANARLVYEAVSETQIEAIYERSSSLSTGAVREFISQLCFVSRSEIRVGNNAALVVPGAEKNDLTQVAYRQQHALLSNASSRSDGEQFHHSQPNIYNLQKLVEVTHYNMESRPRLIFAELWTIVAEHLTSTALHSNPAVAMYAVDSFRQLSIQYLKREELEVFEFQRRFLKPLETVMAQSVQKSTKELLLDCVSRIIHVFRPSASGDEASKQRGGLRSGWIPILTILGLGGCDSTVQIAETSYAILASELRSCLENPGHECILLGDHFVETVQSLFMFVGGPHEPISMLALDQLVALADFLADGSFPLPHTKRKHTSETATIDGPNQDLELWWPILLGFSRVVGDQRLQLRTHALDVLQKVVNKHFFPSETVDQSNGDEMQTLQLIFRGVFTPILEFADSGEPPIPPLPKDFERFLSLPKAKNKGGREVVEESESMGWLETTLDPFLDVCVGICLRAIKLFGDDMLVEEVFAILNSCLLSDSGALAVRGVRRLEQLVTSDLEPSLLNDAVWATVCHMLRRCLAVRGLPPQLRSKGQGGASGAAATATEEEKAEYAEGIREFITEDRFLVDRRYVGSNAVMVVGELLSSNRLSIGMRWRLFLIAGLGNGITAWERAASELAAHKVSDEHLIPRPPHYLETALYGRKWLNRFVLQLASMEDIAKAPADADPKTNRAAAGQKLVTDETHRLLVSFLEKENSATQYRHTEEDTAVYVKFTALVKELLTGYNSMDSEYLKNMSWINPILLSSCIQSKNEDIRLAVQKLVQRTSPGSSSAPSQTSSAKPVEAAADGNETNEASEAKVEKSNGSVEAPVTETATSDE